MVADVGVHTSARRRDPTHPRDGGGRVFLMRPRTFDLFSSVGGWTLGLDWAGFDCAGACEIDDWRRRKFGEWFPRVRVYEDVKKLNGERIRRECGPIDFLVRSPPCKEISSANTRGRGVDGDGLFFEATRLLAELRPTWFAFENSPHLRTKGSDRVLSEIERADYACWPIVVGACHAGAAHRRQRVWLVGRDRKSGEGWASGQSRRSERVDPDSNPELLQRQRRTPGKRQGPREGTDHRDGSSARAQSGAGQTAAIAQADRRRLGPVGAPGLGRHIWAHAGLSDPEAERWRQAYGDAVIPAIARAIGSAVIDTERRFFSPKIQH